MKLSELFHRHDYIDLPPMEAEGAKICYTCGKYAVFDLRRGRTLTKVQAINDVARLAGDEFAGRVHCLIYEDESIFGSGYGIVLLRRACALLNKGHEPDEVYEIIALERMMGVGYVDYLIQAHLWKRGSSR